MEDRVVECAHWSQVDVVSIVRFRPPVRVQRGAMVSIRHRMSLDGPRLTTRVNDAMIGKVIFFAFGLDSGIGASR
jgi:hypothetical protein